MVEFKTKQTKDTDKRCAYFPAVGDVYKTAYKKGVIKEFKKLQDDPIKVAPMVKVEVDGNKSEDYIPIFFKPKEKYWDTPSATSQAFNESSGYYENAWMSFRGDDEVIVQCYEDKPVAVVGFVDGIPRIGEAIISLEGQTFQTSTDVQLLFDTIKQDFYEKNQEIGYDDKDLKLLYPCDIILSEKSSEETPIDDGDWMSDYMNSHTTYSAEYGPTRIEQTEPDIFGSYSIYTYSSVRMAISAVVGERAYVAQYEGKTHHFLVPVGAILYVFQFLTSISKPGTFRRRSHTENGIDPGLGGIGPDYWVEQLTRHRWINNFNPPDSFDRTFPFTLGEAYASWAASRNANYNYAGGDPDIIQAQIESEAQLTSGEDRGRVVLVEIGAAPYTDDLYKRIKGGAAVTYPSTQFVGISPNKSKSLFYKAYTGMYHQVKWRDKLDLGNEWYLAEGEDYTELWQYKWGNARYDDGFDMDTIDMYVRPHTKVDIEQYLGAKGSA